MSEPSRQTESTLSLEQQERIDRICDAFELAWRKGQDPKIESFLSPSADVPMGPVVRELVALEIDLLEEQSTRPDLENYLARFPDYTAAVRNAFEGTLPRSLDSTSRSQPADTESFLLKSDVDSKPETMPGRIGRYSIERVLGRGGFAIVYLAHDSDLNRYVALKVPRLERFSAADAIDFFVEEARNAAALDHPNIVRVYDVQRDPELVYIVQQYIDGQDLWHWLQEKRPGFDSIAELMIKIAEAVGYAHQRGFVHRDLKPANILLDAQGEPYVADLGLALHESVQRDRAGEFAGTRSYMSPEQIRRETHRLDGRSDIWSLGVMLYELLTRRMPFRGETTEALEDEILHRDPKPPRMIDPQVPAELARICLVCLAKRSADRYPSTADLVDDLKHWIAAPNRQLPSASTSVVQHDARETDGSATFVPKGLRSFDASDAGFFLQLLPGPFDREGLPKNIRFWKTQIEQRDADETFAVGLMYGPSGCGKSSLVKAGLLPRLSDDVLPIYVEATADDTELRLLKAIRKHCNGIAAEADLTELIGQLRDGGGWNGRKVLLVIDQFEQWLHAHETLGDSQLVSALRQCDGSSVQCVVLVRDDFWMSATRFFQAIEVPLLEGCNSAAVDLFESDHARHVLSLYGRAYGKLPDPPAALTEAQDKFLSQAVDDLAEGDKVICVRLTVFAEMMKGRPWTKAVLENVGGTEGVGVTFLEETFSARTAPPSHRLHEKATRQILKALLPELGTGIKGHMRSRDELLEASGYANRHDNFSAVLNILDSELRLITPTDPEGNESDEDTSAKTTDSRQRYYQLTHDYLVPSLREWLMRKQKETRQGRAEFELADRAAVWNARPENRQLPSLLQWWRIRWYTDAKQWTEPQRKMMARAGRVLGTRATITSSVVLVFTIALWQLLAWQERDRLKIERQTAQRNTVNAVDSLETAPGAAIPLALEKLVGLPRDMVLVELERRFPDATGQVKLHLAYGLARYQRPDVDTIITGVVAQDTPADEVMNIVVALRPAAEEAKPKLESAANVASGKQDWSTKTRLATVELYLGDPTIAKEMLRDGPEEPGPDVEFDPVERTRFVASFPTWSGDVSGLANLYSETNNFALRSGLALAIGGIKRPSHQAKEAWGAILEEWYVNAPDSGTHGAARWALQQWDLTIPNLADSSRSTLDHPTGRDWWQLDELTMIRMRQGSVRGESGPIVVTNDFWLSDREVSVGLFQQFMDDAEYQGLKPEDWEGAVVFDNDTSPDLPVQQVSWFDAVMFCNWLSWKQKLEPAYEFEETDSSDPKKQYTVQRLPTDGIRLPSVREWEYACRSGTTTDFAFGDDQADLVDYGWGKFNSNTRTHEIGANRCNAWGLFDMHGNVWEWCWGATQDSDRVIRGGSWSYFAEYCRSSFVFVRDPSYRFSFVGFRVARGPSGEVAGGQE